jgi:peptidoglycan hydrolase-like protein with peptidoglycan-binding domain
MLSASVGQDATNDPDDVKTIQRLLGDLQIASGAGPIDVDGLASPETVTAITDFQQNQGLDATGVIEPDDSTCSQLDQVCADLYAAIVQQWAAIALSEPAPDSATQDIIDLLDEIRNDFTTIAPNEPVDGADEFPTPLSDFNAQIASVSAAAPLLGVAQVVPVIIVLFIILAFLIVLTSNPFWQRAAREMIRGLKDRSLLLSQKIRDAIRILVQQIDNILGGTACAELCANEINTVKDLEQQINDLMNRIPENDNDPDALEQLKSQLRDLYRQFLDAHQAVINCVEQNGC